MVGLSKEELLEIKEEHEKKEQSKQDIEHERAEKEEEKRLEIIALLQQRAETFPEEAKEVGWLPTETLKARGLLGLLGVKVWPFIRINEGGFVKRFFIGKNGRILGFRYLGNGESRIVDISNFSYEEVSAIIGFTGNTEKAIGKFFKRLLVERTGFNNEESESFSPSEKPVGVRGTKTSSHHKR
ncbi:MAG: hypothetical protein FWG24_06875 [Eggerthellaceae bacterium]|nr:hypothetical protein [Eggerthellaceae bacterium]